MKVVARAPGKLILSGEYSVLYGMPAIAFAIDEFTEVVASIMPEDGVVIKLGDHRTNLSADVVRSRYIKTQSRFNDFLSGLIPIEKVLEDPVDLCCFIIGKVDKPAGIKLSIKSDIPMASGFGSSAAFVVSLIKALDHLLELSLTVEDFYKLALEAENLVHGTSSGVDIRTSIAGGCNYFYEDRSQINFPEIEFFSIFTGRPEVSTGESIAKVKGLLETSDIKYRFKEVTLNLKQAFEMNELLAAGDHIKRNHLLLKELGVVPGKVQRFIEEIERSHGAAKICGSGAASGDKAGAVIAMGNFDNINEIAQRFGYSVKRINISARGAYVL